MKKNVISFLLLICISLSLLAQADSTDYYDCSLRCIVKYNGDSTDEFYLGKKYITLYNSEPFGLPLRVIINFIVYDVNGYKISETDNCLIDKGCYIFKWVEFLSNIKDLSSGVYKLKMTALSLNKSEQLYSSEKNLIFVR